MDLDLIKASDQDICSTGGTADLKVGIAIHIPGQVLPDI